MPFKEDVTCNIYNSWRYTITACPDDPRRLDDFSIEELNHLKWLIEQEINCRKNK